jgi:hypothetical protein
MAIYNGNTPSMTRHVRKIKGSPKSLTIYRKYPRPGTTTRFSDLKLPSYYADMTWDPIGTFLDHMDQKYNQDESTGALRKRPEDVGCLPDLTTQLIAKSNSCSVCHEPIPPGERRIIRLFIDVPNASVSADDVRFAQDFICMLCTQNMNKARPGENTVAPPAATDNEWKRTLKPRQREAFERHEKGEAQKDICAAMHLSQSNLSKMLQAARKLRDAYTAATS